MAIKKHEEIRLNVKPIFLTLYHEYVFEGPCRFGEGIQLEKEFDLHMAAEKFKGWYAQLQAAMPENVVNLLEPVKVERDENFLTKDEMIDKLAEGSEEVDLYFIGYASRPYDLALELAQRVGNGVDLHVGELEALDVTAVLHELLDLRQSVRPTIMLTSCGSVQSFVSIVPTHSPSRRTVMRSLISNSSLRRWEMKTTVTP